MMGIEQDHLAMATRLVLQAKRVGALAVLALAGYAIWWIVVSPVGQKFSDFDIQISQDIAAIRRLEQAIVLEASQPADNAFEEAASKSSFLAGTEDALIVADLQTKLRALVVSHNSQLISARTLAPKRADSGNYLGLKLEIKGDIRDIHRIIYGIETSEPYLFIDKARLRPSDRRFGEQDKLDATQFQAELDIYGAKRTTTPSPARVRATRSVP